MDKTWDRDDSDGTGRICARQTKDPRTGRISYCIKPKGHNSVMYSEQVRASNHEPHPTHDRAAEMTEALAEDARRNQEKEETFRPGDHSRLDLQEALTEAYWDEEPVTEEAKPVEGTFHTYLKVTPEVIEALRLLRQGRDSLVWQDAINVLDNAGVFAAIDEATGYDVDPEPVRISKCTCPRTYGGEFLRMGHRTGCPGDPAEWGDLAYTTKTLSGPTWDDKLFKKED